MKYVVRVEQTAMIGNAPGGYQGLVASPAGRVVFISMPCQSERIAMLAAVTWAERRRVVEANEGDGKAQERLGAPVSWDDEQIDTIKLPRSS
jgi:hypothetical protein